MRIVAGKYGGRRLDVPKNRDIRPTSDKVRGAIFNALDARGAIEGAAVLDCFCGTGALGLEALSRGADSCEFWDKDKQSLALAKANAEALGAQGQSEFVLRDASKGNAPFKDKIYDLVFLDAPYRKGLVDITVQYLQENNSFSPSVTVVIEAERDYEPNLDGSFTVQFEKIYGDTKVLFLGCA